MAGHRKRLSDSGGSCATERRLARASTPQGLRGRAPLDGCGGGRQAPHEMALTPAARQHPQSQLLRHRRGSRRLPDRPERRPARGLIGRLLPTRSTPSPSKPWAKTASTSPPHTQQSSPPTCPQLAMYGCAWWRDAVPLTDENRTRRLRCGAGNQRIGRSSPRSTQTCR